MNIRMGLSSLLIIAVILFSALPLFAKESSGIVVWKLSANENIEEKDVDLLSNFVTNQVAKYSGQKVISEADINTILKGVETKQDCGIDDTVCLAEIGMALGVPEAISGDIGKIGSYWMLNLRRIDVRSAEVIGRSSRSIEGSVDLLIRVLPGAVGELFKIQANEIPKAAKTPTSGKLFVTSKPDGAIVAIDGKNAGETPLEKTLEINLYKVRVERRGYKPYQEDVKIRPGVKTELKVDLERIPPGRLKITSRPAGATVLLNDEEKGKTPYGKVVDSGEYELELRLAGYKTIDQAISVKPQRKTKLSFYLERDYPMNPYKKYGYVTFFSGVGLVAFGGLATAMSSANADDYHNASSVSKAKDLKSTGESWMGAAYFGYGLGGASMITGVVLWVLSPGDQKWWEEHPISVGPMENAEGVSVSLGGRW